MFFYFFAVDPGENIVLDLWTDNLQSCGESILNPPSSVYIMPFKLQDSSKRVVYIQLKVRRHYGKAIKVIEIEIKIF